MIELTGAYPALHQAIRVAGVDGTVVAAGFYQGPATALALGEEFHHNRVTLVSSQIGSLPLALRDRWSRERLHQTVIKLCAAGRLDPMPLVTHLIPAKRAAEAYELVDKSTARSAASDLGLQESAEPSGGGRVRHTVRLAVQEQYLRGPTMIDKWDHARRLGFDAIELRGAGEGRFAARLPELKAAAAAGVIDANGLRGDAALRGRLRRRQARGCAGSDEVPALGHGRDRRPAGYDAGLVRDVQQAAATVRAATIGGAEDTEILLDAFGQLAAHAGAEGVIIALEPLNRYENHMINTLADAQALCEKIGSRHLGIAADTYHMNIEEADPPKALIDGGPWIRHVQLSDSNRLEPGAGHIDWSGDPGCAVGNRL